MSGRNKRRGRGRKGKEKEEDEGEGEKKRAVIKIAHESQDLNCISERTHTEFVSISGQSVAVGQM